MRCLECGAELDELNESQPVCPACGAPPGMGRDDEDVCALLDDAALIAAASDQTENADAGLGLDEQEGVVILSVRPNSRAARIGFRAGDIIQQVGRSKIETVGDLEGLLKERQQVWLVLLKRGSQQVRLQLAG